VGWRTPRHFVSDSEPVLAVTRERGLEGVVAKWLGSLAGAFRAKGLNVEIALPPEHGDVFFARGNESITGRSRFR
jgi:hypothetical protein